MTLELLTRISDALKDAWEHKWTQSAINERLAHPDGSGNRRWWSSQKWGPAYAARRRPDDEAPDDRAAGPDGRRRP